jgi:hypothetical protein
MLFVFWLQIVMHESAKKIFPFGILLVKILKFFVKFLYIKKLEKKEKPWNQELIKLYTSLCLRVKEGLCCQ